MTDTTVKPISFDYRAQTVGGQAISGSIDALNVEQAQRLLASLQLRVLEIEPAARVRGKPLSSDDFLAFNQQLAHLTSAGVPVEQGLRLVAQDMHSGRLAATIKQLVSEMEKGTPLDQAFDKQREQFPPLYGRLVAAGISAGDLPGVLFNMGRHLELVQRVRAALWRALAYPIVVLAAVSLILLVLGYVVIPQFAKLFDDMHGQLPRITEAILAMRYVMPAFVGFLIIVFIGFPLLWQLFRATGRDRAVIDRLVLPLPLIGPILKANLASRWCDAVKIGVSAGLDLPRAIDLASDAVASPAARRDGDALRTALESGRTLESVQHTRVLPATVPAAMSFSSKHHNLAETMATLAQMYQQQADMRLAILPAILTPVLVLFLAMIIGTIIAGMFLQFLSLISALV
jgi:type IV pilus assembly protein PilC